jgi:hypothetical protein
MITVSKRCMKARSSGLLSQMKARIGEAEAPGPGAEEGIDVEFHQRHAGDAGRQRDECPHPRQHPGHEDGGAAVAGEEAVGPSEVAAAHQEIATPALDEPPPTVTLDGIGHRRAEIAADGARARRRDQDEMAQGGELPANGMMFRRGAGCRWIRLPSSRRRRRGRWR